MAAAAVVVVVVVVMMMMIMIMMIETGQFQPCTLFLSVTPGPRSEAIRELAD